MALIRYPGSKRKLANQILSYMPPEIELPLWSHEWEYREPFFGAGAIGFRILEKLPPKCRIWINDIDYHLVCLWKSVKEAPDELQEMIRAFTPTAAAFEDFKKNDNNLGRGIDVVVAGFQKLALHQMSFSGLGYMSGGPLGGKDQSNGKYAVDCRWSPAILSNHVGYIHKLFKRFPSVQITCKPFEKVLQGATEKTLVYLDPPYIGKGPILYKYSMSDVQHSTLAKYLRDAPYPWVLSYDDVPKVRDMYEGFCIHELQTTYTSRIQRGDSRPKNQEVLLHSLACT